MKIGIVFLSALFFGLVGCMHRLQDTKLSEEYYIYEVDSRPCICFLDDGKYYIRVIGPYVYAVGANKNHIIVKEHPLRDLSIDRSVTLYYIIPLTNRVSVDGEKNYYGPFDENQFNRKREELAVNPDLEFTIHP